MSIERSFNVEMMVGIEAYWDSRKSAVRQETSKVLAHRGTASAWIHVKHLASAIDDHPELHHFVCAKETIDMRRSLGIGNMRSCSGTAVVSVETGKICDRHRYVCQRAIAHRDAFYFAGAKAFPAPAKQTTHVRASLFHSQTECIHAIGVNGCVRRSSVNHQRSWPIVDGDRNQQMIAKASLQFCTGKALFGKKPG